MKIMELYKGIIILQSVVIMCLVLLMLHVSMSQIRRIKQKQKEREREEDILGEMEFLKTTGRQFSEKTQG